MKLKPWKHSTKPTIASKAHVEIGQQTFTDSDGAEYGFWSLAPGSDFDRYAKQTKLASKANEYVWLIRDQIAYEVVADTMTGAILTFSRSMDYQTDYAQAA